MAKLLHGIERKDRTAFNQLVDWWKRQSTVPAPVDVPDLGAAVSCCVLSLPEGWEPGRVIPLEIDGRRPFVWDVTVCGYPNLLELNQSAAAFFQLQWEGQTSGPIAFDADADQFRAALPYALRVACEVHGGRVVDERAGVATEFNLMRWWISCPLPVEGLTAVAIDADAAQLIVGKSMVRPAAAAMDCWALVTRNAAPRISSGALALAWQTQGTGLVLGAIEPRIAEPYVRTLPNATGAG